MVSDWITREVGKNERTGIQWTLTEQLEDLDFADDVCLISATHKQMQRKTEKLSVNASKLGMSVNIPKTKVLKVNGKMNSPVSLPGEVIESVDEFCYLGSVISTDGGTDKDISVRIGKARYEFRAVQPVWLSRQLSLNTKLRIFSTNVNSVLLYGFETWRSTKALHH